MSVKERSFLSTTTGIVTGVATLLTAIVGIVTAGATLGWFGGKSSGKTVATTTTTTVNPSVQPGLVAPTSSVAAVKPQFTVIPAAGLKFQPLGPLKQTVTVQNSGDAAFTLPAPTVDGADASQFTARSLTCATRLDAGRSCDVEVTFAATKSGTSKANLVVQPVGAAAKEVPLEGSALL